jgi:hypothetical protein
MTAAERLNRWNAWYDGMPPQWRFQLILWPLIVLGGINLSLTIAFGFPFALLVLLGVLAAAIVRVPYVLGWIAPATAADAAAIDGPRFQIAGADWVVDLNRRYEAVPEIRRIWVATVILLIAGGINMLLTIYYNFPFGLLFLLALLALVAIRAPYAAGWLKYPGSGLVPVAPPPAPAGIEHAPTAPLPIDTPVAAPVALDTPVMEEVPPMAAEEQHLVEEEPSAEPPYSASITRIHPHPAALREAEAGHTTGSDTPG